MIHCGQCPDHQTSDKVCDVSGLTNIMMFPPHLPVALVLQGALCLVASAATNYSVDDQDPLFQYFGSWQRITTNLNSAGGNLDDNGGHMLTYTVGSSATITYTCACSLKVNSKFKSSQSIPFHLTFFFFPLFLWQWSRWSKMIIYLQSLQFTF